MVVYLDIPSRMGRPEDFTQTESTDALYDRELEKAKEFSDTFTQDLYMSSLISHLVTIPFRLILTPFFFIKNWCAQENLGDSYELMTVENCQRQLDHLIAENGENHESVLRQRKFMRVLEKMQGLAGSVNVDVNFYYKPVVDVAAAFTESIYFGSELLHMDEDEMEAILAHEIQHIAGKHLMKKLALEVAELAIDIFLFLVIPVGIAFFETASFAVVPVFGVLLFETAAFFINSYVSKHFEKEADLRGMDLLGSNEGEAKYWKRRIELGTVRYVPTSIQVPFYRKEGLTDEQMFEIRKARMPSFPTHPWTSDRYDYCREYTTVTSEVTDTSQV